MQLWIAWIIQRVKLNSERMHKTSKTEASIENIYRLEGRVPVAKAIPFGLQHILAMFVANIAPIIIAAAACGLSASESA